MWCVLKEIMNFGVLADFFNISSVSAFIGALSAFLLVHYSDRFRVRRKHKILPKLIEGSLDDCRAKIETVEMNRAALVDDNTVIPAPIMKFALDDIKYIRLDVLDHMKTDERRALDGLCYTMVEIDNILDGILKLAEKLYTSINSNSPVATQSSVGKELVKEYDSALINLRRLEKMATNFVKMDFTGIVTKKYRSSDYQQPSAP